LDEPNSELNSRMPVPEVCACVPVTDEKLLIAAAIFVSDVEELNVN